MNVITVTEAANGWTVDFKRSGFVSVRYVFGRDASIQLASFLFTNHASTPKPKAR